MLVGTSGTGKSVAWRLVSGAIQRAHQIKTHFHVIDAKTVAALLYFRSCFPYCMQLSKEELFGTLESTTREWTDGNTNCLLSL